MNCSVCGQVLSGERCEGCGARRGRHRIPLSGLSGPKYASNWKVLALSLAGAALITGGVFWALTDSADEEIKRQGTFDDEVALPPGKEFGYSLRVAISSSYSFTAQPVDGAVVMAVGRVDDGDTKQMSPKDIATALENATAVDAGGSKTLTGTMDRGRYVWVVANPSKDKKVRVRISFH